MRIIMRRNYGVTKDGLPWLKKDHVYSTVELGLSREEEIMILATRKADIAPDTTPDELFGIEKAVVKTPEKRTTKPRRKKANDE